METSYLPSSLLMVSDKVTRCPLIFSSFAWKSSQLLSILLSTKGDGNRSKSQIGGPVYLTSYLQMMFSSSPKRRALSFTSSTIFLKDSAEHLVCKLTSLSLELTILQVLLMAKSPISPPYLEFKAQLLLESIWVFLCFKADLRKAISTSSSKNRLLNRTGRLTLASSVLSSIPTYYMQINWLPQNICDSIDQITRNFLWKGTNNKGIHLVNWKKFTSPNSAGGLGIRTARDANTSLLGKLVWNMVQSANKLWVNILSNKYTSGPNTLHAIANSNSSPTWSSIIKAKDILRSGYVWRASSGSSSFWFNHWSSHGLIDSLVPIIDIHDLQLTVRDVFTYDGQPTQALYTTLPHTIAELINNSHINFNERVEDTFIWKENINGAYTAKSGYSWLLGNSVPTNNPPNMVSWSWIKSHATGARSTIFLAGLWWTWRQRNQMCLSADSWSLTQINFQVQNTATTIETAMHYEASPHPDRMVRWNSNNYNCCVLNVDGSCLGTPIRAGFGGIIRNSAGLFLTGFSSYLATTSDILYAELTTIHRGLLLAIDSGIDEMVCYWDSMLSIQLLIEHASIYHAYAVLLQDIKDHLPTRNFIIQHCLREGNQCADFLAKLGATSNEEFSTHDAPPSDLLSLIKNDAMEEN